MCEQIFGAESGRNSSVRQKQPSAACERMFGPKRGPLAGLVVFVDVVTSDGLDASPVFARRVASLGGEAVQSSCMTTASAPSGTGAPVKIRATVPVCSGWPLAPAAMRWDTGKVVPNCTTSAQRSA